MKQKLKTLIEMGLEKLREEYPFETMPAVLLEIPKKENQGDYSTPVAMGLGSLLRQPPRKIAEKLVKALPEDPSIEKIDVAGPGYLNFTFKRSHWNDVLKEVVLKGPAYGRSPVRKGGKVQVEFVSANPTGPLHVGHGRGAVVGDALSNLLEAVGYEVEREYYINDVGRQVELLGQSVYQRYRELNGEKAEIPEGGYLGDYVTEIAREIRKHSSRIPAEQERIGPFFSTFAKEKILEEIRRDLKFLGVEIPHWYSEKSLYDSGSVDKVLGLLKEKGLLYEAEGGTWLATSRFGDDKDRIVIKSNGDKTYFASDVAYHYEKCLKGFQRIINIWGADHHGYILRMKASLAALEFDPDVLRVLLLQLVTLSREGKPVPMSKRAGEYVTVRDVIDEVGADATRFFFLLRGTDSALDFDLELAKKQSSENPVYYVQYAHARLCSVFRNAEERNISLDGDIPDLTLLSLPQETALMKQLAWYPLLLEESAEALEPHRISYYLQDLAAMLHQYYYKTRIISDETELTRSRLYLSRGIRVVLKNALEILGIGAPEKM